MEVFSGCGARVADFCGSVGGAACPFPLRFSLLGTARPFCFTGRDSGEPLTDDACEAEGDAWGLSCMSESRGVVTVAMVSFGDGLLPRRWGMGDLRLRSAEELNAEREKLSAKAVWTTVPGLVSVAQSI